MNFVERGTLGDEKLQVLARVMVLSSIDAESHGMNQELELQEMLGFIIWRALLS